MEPASIRWATVLVTAAMFVGCAGPSVDRAPKRPPDLGSVPDAVPKVEPRSASGNPPFYEVYGRRYHVLPTASGYRERGVASWYGEKFHGRRTSSGEPYDMYAMTAAHKTLPLPAYVRVTNLENRRSIVVRVNDRGPFVDNRLIDLSYAAAVRLDMITEGTAMVQVEAIDPSARATAAPVAEQPPPDDAVYVQAGAFRSRLNAESLAQRIRAEAVGLPGVYVLEDKSGNLPIYRVRIGPISGVEDFDRVVEKMTMIGIPDAYLALD